MKVMVFDASLGKKDLLVPYFKSKLAVVDEASDVDAVMDYAKYYLYDAIIIRLTKERPSDIDVIKRIRGLRVQAPIIVLGRSLTEHERLRILHTGADDLVTEQFSSEEIYLKTNILIRRCRGHMENTLKIGKVEVRMDEKRIFIANKEVKLTKKEYQITEILALRRGTLLPKEQILDHLYGGLDEPNPKIVDVFVCKIRGKMEAAGVDDFITTVWGRGYMIPEASSAEILLNLQPAQTAEQRSNAA